MADEEPVIVRWSRSEDVELTHLVDPDELADTPLPADELEGEVYVFVDDLYERLLGALPSGILGARLRVARTEGGLELSMRNSRNRVTLPADPRDFASTVKDWQAAVEGFAFNELHPFIFAETEA